MTSELVPWAVDSPVEVSVAPRGVGRPIASIVALPPSPVDRPRGLYVRACKPLADRVLSIVGLLVAAIPMLIIAGVIAVVMGRPVLFRQRRVGRDGGDFEVLKFRTMRPDRRALRLDVIHDRRCTHKSIGDPRHTALGRFLRRTSLDELPQLINVARGEMSIVGPRPELIEVVEGYPPGLHQRHLVKPGLTGLWQISARGSGPMHQNGHFDIAYVASVSLRTDLAIIARTPGAIFGGNAGS
jgi:lipopolysaccharide/colanic/teichoic acid biosynthesis glycosyltransferase